MKNNLLLFPFVIIIVIIGGYAYRIYEAGKVSQTISQIQSERQNPQIVFPPQGGTLYKGHTYSIQWTGGTKGEALFLSNVALQKEGMSVSLVDRVYDISDTNTFQYTIPSDIPDGKYTISIANLTSGEFNITSQN